MDSHIADILNGKFEYDVGTLTIPERRIECDAVLGEKTAGVFHLVSPSMRKCTGAIYSNEPRLVCDRRSFSASSVEVHYTFDTTGLEIGDIVKGEINIISDAGEYHLPFVFNIHRHFTQSSEGKIKNLFHFTNLARSNFDEAVEVFYGKDFEDIFTGVDERYLGLYKPFSIRKDSRENVEEFLIAVHKKTPVSYSLNRNEIEVSTNGEDKCCEIVISKNGWGDVSLRVVSRSDFIVCEKQYLANDDFKNDTCVIKLLMIGEAMHAGNNYGEVTISGTHFADSISVVAHRSVRNSSDILERQKIEYALMNEFIRFRLHDIKTDVWCKASLVYIEKITSHNPNDISARLYMVHVLITGNRIAEAQSVLRHVKGQFDMRSEGEEYEAYVLYLEAMLDRDEVRVKKNAQLVRDMYANNTLSSRLLWLLLYMDEKYEADSEEKINMMSSLFLRGGNSPLIYVEAFNMFTKDPKLLTSMSEFETNVLWWGVKRGRFADNLVQRMIFHGSRLKEYSPVYVRLMGEYYKKFKLEEILGAICSHLIQNHVALDSHFKWFKLAALSQIKITRLYEYYMYSFPENTVELIDRSVLMYFKMGADLTDDRTTLLYVNLIKHAGTAGDYLAIYNPQICEFALRMAELGKINENLSIIYEYVLSFSNMDKRQEFLRALCKLAFVHKVTVKDKSMKTVSVVENGLIKEHRYILSKGEAYVSVYSNDYVLIFEDEHGNRTVDRHDVEDKRLLQPLRLDSSIREYLADDIGSAVYICRYGRKFIEVDEGNAGAVKSLVMSDEISNSEKDEMRKNLMHYYYDKNLTEELDELLIRTDMSKVGASVRPEIIRYMVIRGMPDRAYAVIKRYGADRVDPKVIVRLVSRLVSEGHECEDRFLRILGFRAFKHGKYDENLLAFLSENYYGCIQDLRDIWKAASDFHVPVGKLERRMISQMLFAHSYVGEADEIFKDYAGKDGNDDLAKAWLTYSAYDYFVKNRITGDYVFERIYRLLQENEEFAEVAKISLLYYFSKKGSVPEDFRNGIRAIVCSYLHKGIMLEFFRKFREFVPEVGLYDDRTFIEYRTSPFKKVVLHYIVSKENSSDSGFYNEAMKNVVEGVYAKNFVLFYGERLQYYITEEVRDSSQLTTSRTLEAEEAGVSNSETRYELLNEILLSRDVGDTKSMESLIDLYMNKMMLSEQKFSLI
ncbi:MAG: DUF5717 family protein [Lachnospiraceae bacterium]|nr:DUF5717 family protein [Lachnospiraceae bacterium]